MVFKHHIGIRHMGTIHLQMHNILMANKDSRPEEDYIDYYEKCIGMKVGPEENKTVEEILQL